MQKFLYIVILFSLMIVSCMPIPRPTQATFTASPPAVNATNNVITGSNTGNNISSTIKYDISYFINFLDAIPDPHAGEDCDVNTAGNEVVFEHYGKMASFKGSGNTIQWALYYDQAGDSKIDGNVTDHKIRVVVTTANNNVSKVHIVRVCNNGIHVSEAETLDTIPVVEGIWLGGYIYQVSCGGGTRYSVYENGQRPTSANCNPNRDGAIFDFDGKIVELFNDGAITIDGRTPRCMENVCDIYEKQIFQYPVPMGFVGHNIPFPLYMHGAPDGLYIFYPNEIALIPEDLQPLIPIDLDLDEDKEGSYESEDGQWTAKYSTKKDVRGNTIVAVEYKRNSDEQTVLYAEFYDDVCYRSNNDPSKHMQYVLALGNKIIRQECPPN